MTGTDIKNYRKRRGVTLAEGGSELHISAQAVAKAEAQPEITQGDYLRYTAAIETAQVVTIQKRESAGGAG